MSPVVLRTKNLFVRVYSRDHMPPHVHVVGPGSEASFLLDGMVCVRSRGFSAKALRLIRKFLLAHGDKLKEAWDERKG